jgi:hypothetical protein
MQGGEMRQKKVAWFMPVIATVLLLASSGYAQTVSTGTIAGVVKDTGGGVLPGVSVEVTSPALIEKTRTTVTDSQGQYRVVDLRPGIYSVTFTLPGFGPVRQEAIELTAGFTAPINAELGAAAIEETVVVTGASPVVDVQNVTTQTVLTRDRIDAIPATQSMMGIASVTVGMTAVVSGASGIPADVGGSKGEQISAMAVHGGDVGDQIAMIDGLSTHHPLFTGSGFFRLAFFNQIMAQEIDVVARGGSGEVQTAGVQLNMVTKSGGNTWHGAGVANGTNEHFNATNLDDYLISRGVATPATIKNIWDIGVGIGGPIVHDKLWMYASVRNWGASEYITGNYYNATQGTFVYTPDLNRPAERPSPNQDYSVNFTWQATPKDRITVYPMVQNNCNCRRGVNSSPPTAPEATEMGRFGPLVYLASTWSRPVSNRFLLQAGFMYVDTNARWREAPEVIFGDAPVRETSTGISYNSRVDTGLNRIHDPQGNGYVSASYVTGSHALKAGFTFLRGYLDQSADATNEPPITYTVRRPTSTALPVPVSITQYALPTQQRADIITNGLYVQDQWTLNRLTANVGLRYDYLHAWVPAQTRPAGYFTPSYSFDMLDNVPKWRDISPRLGIAYDLFGNGKTAVKASFGRYVAAESLSIAQATNPVNAIVINATRTWSDPNFDPTVNTGSYTPPCDLLNPATNGGCGPLSSTLFGTRTIGTTYAPDVLLGWNVRPAVWQTSTSVSQELYSGVALTVGYYRTSYDNIRVTRNTAIPSIAYDPFCVTLPVDSRLPGDGGNEVCGYYDVQPAFFAQTRNVVTQASNFGDAKRIYNGFDINLNARIPTGILVAGGMSAGNTVTDNCFVVNSPQELRHCRIAIPWEGQQQFKASVIYPLPFWNLRTSAVYQNLSGVPILATNYVVTNAQVAPSLGRNLAVCGTAATCNGTVTLSNLIEPNADYEGRLQQLDVRMSKLFRLAGSTLTGNFDIYNVLNANPILNRNNTYTPTGTSWGRPTDVLAGRLFKFGVQLSF